MEKKRKSGPKQKPKAAQKPARANPKKAVAQASKSKQAIKPSLKVTKRASSAPASQTRGSTPKTEQIDLSEAISNVEGKETVSVIDSYQTECRSIPLEIKIYRRPGDYTFTYEVFIPSIGSHTRVILEKIRQELVKKVNLGIANITDRRAQQHQIEESFKETIQKLVREYFPAADNDDTDFFVSFVLLRSIGLGEVEILMSDPGLEEIAINGANQPIWVFHRKLGWLRTNITLDNEEQIRYFATTIGRRVGRQISVLDPLMDVTLDVGDRVNATLMPISNDGNTITIRKFASKPWTITDFLRAQTITYEAAALLWQGIQYEMSILIAGGTASGKTSMLNILSNFFPPNQRILSIEDTREIKLPKFLHWVPMLTRLPNTEGRGGVSMLRLLQNSLRQRPDRILVGEIRRPEEAETLFEAIHTGHSVYATVHANTAEETITRLTNPPINVPKTMISALALVVVQYRNRRTGKRRTFQIAEVLGDGEPNVLLQYEPKKDRLIHANQSKSFIKTLETFAGISKKELAKALKEKEEVLRWMVKKDINTVEGVGETMADYYTNYESLKKRMRG